MTCVVKNRTLQEMARTMISEYDLPQYLWAEALNTACYISNRIYLCKNSLKTSLEIYHSRKSNVSYFKIFGCKCFVLNTKDNLGKFDAKAYEAIFVGYSTTSKAYRVFNRSSLTIEESMHVKFEESNVVIENVVEFDSLGEDMEKLFLKDSPIQEEKEEPIGDVQKDEVKDSQPLPKDLRTLQIISRNSS